MSANYFNFVATLPQIAETVYPEIRGFKKLRYNARFCLWSLLKPNVTQRMQALFDKPGLTEVIKQHPRIIEKPLKPYVCLGWRPEKRAQKVYEHFEMLHGIYGKNTPNLYSPSGYTIASIEGFRVVLCSGPEREGSLAVKLVDEFSQDLFTIAFNISTDPERTIHIGALQGPGEHIQDRGEIIKSLTKTMHGLRPKALVLEVLLILARHWNVKHVFGVTNKGHIYQALRYTGSKRSSITYNYAELWTEYGGEEVSKYLCSLPVEPLRKDPSLLKRTKRRLYTKRYQWLDELELSVVQSIAELEE